MVIGDEAAAFAKGAYAKHARKKALRGRGLFCGIVPQELGNRMEKGSSLF
jgi:hypothetical protein